MMTFELENNFSLGCNYWASDSGPFMWQKWNEKAVEYDFKILSENKIKLLRVFPLWSDFQPLRILYGEFGQLKEVRMREEPPTSDPCSQACIDPVMIERFERFCQLAQKYDLELTVMLLTGWMSGRQFKPEPLHQLNIFTDPFALKWQTKFIQYFVEHFKSYSAIKGWGVGNESNIMSPCPSSEAAFTWSALITNTIRSVDNTKPIISGMHGLTVDDPANPWRIEDQGQLCDIVTTHPYASFVKYCQEDPLTSMRNTLHSAAESTLYSDISGKPCMSEELGDLGRTMLDKDSAKIYLDTILWSCWSNGNLGCLWWEAFQMEHLEQAPFDWFEFEQDLGLFDTDKKPKPVVAAFHDFDKMLESLPAEYKFLPSRKRDAVCILTHGQDNWATAFTAFILAKQVGFDIKFIGPDMPIPPAELYMLPSLCGFSALPRRNWQQLFKYIKDDSATLYLSSYDALLPDLEKFAGLQVQTRQAWQIEPTANFADDSYQLQFPPDRTFAASTREGGIIAESKPYRLVAKSCGAKILATDSESVPMFTKNIFGNGDVYFLNFGMEMILAKNAGSFDENSSDYGRIYKEFSNKAVSNRLVKKDSLSKMLALTEHPIDTDKTICVGVNHSFKKMKSTLKIADCVKNCEPIVGNISCTNGTLNYVLNPGEGFVVELSLAVVIL